MGKPVWGTCAGLIFLANKATGGFSILCSLKIKSVNFMHLTLIFFPINAHIFSGQKRGGQDLVGGLDCTVNRNFFGSQVILSTIQSQVIYVVPR